MTKENFSLDELNPVEWIKKGLKALLILLLQTIIFGTLFYIIIHRLGLLDNQRLELYIKYFLIGSLVSYTLSFLYFAYLCRNNKFDAAKLAKMSMLGPSVIVAHIIILVSATFLIDIPEIGPLIYLIIWSSFGAFVIPGFLYTFGADIAQKTASCSSIF